MSSHLFRVHNRKCKLLVGVDNMQCFGTYFKVFEQIGLQRAPYIFFSTSTFYYALYLVFLLSSTTYISAPYIIQPIFSISSLSLFFCVTRECQHLIFGIPHVVFCQVSKSFIALVLIRTNVLFLIVYHTGTYQNQCSILNSLLHWYLPEPML